MEKKEHVEEEKEEKEEKKEKKEKKEQPQQSSQNSISKIHEMDDEVEDLTGPFSKNQRSSTSYCLSPEKGWIVVNMSEGLAIVQDRKITKYCKKDGPFKQKAGVKASCVLPDSNLIAVVPTQQANVIYDIPDTGEEIEGKRETRTTSITVNPNTVYIFDTLTNTILYSKCFNKPIDNVKTSNSFIAVSGSNRVVIFKYTMKNAIHRQTNKQQLQRLIEGYKKGNFDDTVRYVEVTPQPGLTKPIELQMNRNEPARLAFVKIPRNTLYIYDSNLDIFLNIAMRPNESSFCLSPDGKYVALVSDGAVNIRIVEVDTRQTFTQFYRGGRAKDLVCMGFCGKWFNIASSQGASGTFHIFHLRKQQQPNEVISSRFKRYFNTYNQNVDFIVRDGKVIVFSLAGFQFEALNLKEAEKTHAQQASFKVDSGRTMAWT